MKTCLFITTQFPYPLDNGGKIGAYNGLSVVSMNYKVTALSFTEQREYVEEGMSFFSKELPNVHFEYPIQHNVHIRKKPLSLIRVMIKDYLLSKPYVTMKFENKNMYKAIDKQFQSTSHFDLVFIDYLNMGIYQEYIQKKYSKQFGQIVLKDHNKEFEIVKQEEKRSNGLKKIILGREGDLTLKYEKKCIESVNKAFSVCDDNTEFLRQNNSFSYTMLPTFFILPHRQQINNHNILYMGNLSWRANFEGLKWFVDNVMPLVRRKYPDTQITVVGSGPNTESLKRYSFVKHLGYVKDISHIYDEQTIFVVPLFEGSGIRIKILEAFNNEIAVVSTTLGCETIGAMDKKEILIADDAEEFAESIISLFENYNLRLKIIQSAKKLLEDKYTLKARSEEFRSIMESPIV